MLSPVLLPALLLVIAVFLVITVLAWALQERFAFQPPPPPFPSASSTPKVEYEASDGQLLFAFVVGRERSPDRLLLCFHGNADLAIHQIEWAVEVADRAGCAVMLAEYRGYMGVPGRPTYLTSQIDSEAAYRYARDVLHVSRSRMAFFGHSLGSAIATELAARHHPASLLLQAPFTSARDMARRVGSRPVLLVWKMISRLHFDTASVVASLPVPVWVCHGTKDRVVPLWMGERIHATAKLKGQLLRVAGAVHNDVHLVGGDAYWRWLSAGLMATAPPAVRTGR